MLYFDPLYFFFLIPGVLLGIYAQVKLSSAYHKYMRVRIQSGFSGAEAAHEILQANGLSHVPIHEVPGNLTDHYDPRKRALFLSSANFHERSLAAVGVAAHEAGHALQHQASYAPLNLRMAIVPMTRFASVAWVPLFLAGMWLQISQFLWIAVAIFGISTLFQLITLPVEFDASRRAKAQLTRMGIVHSQEAPGVDRVLNAAALTYVAGLVTSILQLLYFISVAQRRN